jgi:hypothetical protein
MFRALAAGSVIEATPEQVVVLMRSVNFAAVSFGGSRKLPSRAYVLGVRHHDLLSLYIALRPHEGEATFLFSSDPPTLQPTQYPRVEQAAQELLRRYGFSMERLAVSEMHPQQLARLLGELPLRRLERAPLERELTELLAGVVENDPSSLIGAYGGGQLSKRPTLEAFPGSAVTMGAQDEEMIVLTKPSRRPSELPRSGVIPGPPLPPDPYPAPTPPSLFPSAGGSRAVPQHTLPQTPAPFPSAGGSRAVPQHSMPQHAAPPPPLFPSAGGSRAVPQHSMPQHAAPPPPPPLFPSAGGSRAVPQHSMPQHAAPQPVMVHAAHAAPAMAQPHSPAPVGLGNWPSVALPPAPKASVGLTPSAPWRPPAASNPLAALKAARAALGAGGGAPAPHTSHETTNPLSDAPMELGEELGSQDPTRAESVRALAELLTLF